MFGWLVSAFKGIGKGLVKFFKVASDQGLTEPLVTTALTFVREAQGMFDTGEERRKWVAAAVKTAFPKLSDSLINLAIELAVQSWKAGHGK